MASKDGDAANKSKDGDAANKFLFSFSASTHNNDAAKEGSSPYWDELWKGGMPAGEAFDAPAGCEALRRYLETMDLKGDEVALIPGAGRGHDAIVLAKHVGRVVSLDMSPHAIAAAKAWHAEQASPGVDKVEFVEGDFFEHEGAYDVIFDCTFLCALHPRARERWAKQETKLLKPGGRVISLVFPIESSMRTSAIQLVRYYMAGPPYTISTALVEQLLNAEADYETEHCSAEHPHLAGNPMGATSALLVLKKK